MWQDLEKPWQIAFEMAWEPVNTTCILARSHDKRERRISDDY